MRMRNIPLEGSRCLIFSISLREQRKNITRRNVFIYRGENACSISIKHTARNGPYLPPNLSLPLSYLPLKNLGIVPPRRNKRSQRRLISRVNFNVKVAAREIAIPDRDPHNSHHERHDRSRDCPADRVRSFAERYAHAPIVRAEIGR